ncbi:MAG: polymer-forming cytoskeletal protein [Pseudomonadota bacterium]
MEKNKKQTLFIDRDSRINGHVKFNGRMIVSGFVQGEIAGDYLILAKDGHVSADVKVDEVLIAGTFQGTITAQNRLRISGTGNASGTLFCDTLIIEQGGILNGNVKRINQDQVIQFPAAKPSPISSQQSASQL